MKKLWRYLPLILAAIIVGVGLYVKHLRNEIVALKLDKDSIIQVDENTKAVLTQTTNTLRETQALADKLHADLIASANVVVKPRPVYVHDTVEIPVEILKDSTRIARYIDTTEAGILDATITAPPCCAGLRIKYDFMPAPVDIQVALLRTEADRAIFSVIYRGGSQEITAPFAKLPKKEKVFGAYLEGLINFTGPEELRVGGFMRTIPSWKLYLFGEVSQGLAENENPNIYIGIRKQL